MAPGQVKYVDGRIVERNLGEKDHSRPHHRKLIGFFGSPMRVPSCVLIAFPEQRVQNKGDADIACLT